MKNNNSWTNVALTLFAITSKEKVKKQSVYWVIDESEEEKDTTIVKYFNEQDEVVFEESLPIKNGRIDVFTMEKINQTKAEIRQGRL